MIFFVHFHSTKEPVYKEEEEAFTQWWHRTPLGKKRQKANEMESDMRISVDTKEQPNGGKPKGKGKKK